MQKKKFYKHYRSNFLNWRCVLEGKKNAVREANALSAVVPISPRYNSDRIHGFFMNIHDTPSGHLVITGARKTLGYYLGISRSDNIARRRYATRIFNDAANGGARGGKCIFRAKMGRGWDKRGRSRDRLGVEEAILSHLFVLRSTFNRQVEI